MLNTREELKQQLGDHLPGALKVAAESMGVTLPVFIKMMENSQVMAEDFLPKFIAKYREMTGPGLQQATRTFAAQQGRLANQFDRLRNTIFTTGLEQSLNKIMFSISDLMMVLENLMRGGLGTFLSKLIDGFTIFGRLLSAVLHDITVFIKETFNLEESVDSLFTKMTNGFFAATGFIAGLWLSIKAGKILFRVLSRIIGLDFTKLIENIRKIRFPGGGTLDDLPQRGKPSASTSRIPKLGMLGQAGMVAGAGFFGFELANMFGAEALGKKLGSGFFDLMNPQKQDVNVNIKLNEGQFKGVLDASVENSNQKLIQSIEDSTLNR